MHVETGELQAYLDGALDERARAGVSGHLAACTECAAELEELKRLSAIFTGAVALLDPEEPVEVPAFSPRPGGPGAWWAGAGGALLRAAVIVLLVGGVAWGALPGSPLRGWALQLWHSGTERIAGGEPEEAAVPEPVQAALSGISILPDGGAARVVIREPDPALRVRLRLVAAERLTAEWRGTGGDPSFRTASGRIEVVRGGAGELVIEAPRSARVLVEVEGREVAVVEDGRIRRSVPAEVDGEDIILTVRGERS